MARKKYTKKQREVATRTPEEIMTRSQAKQERSQQSGEPREGTMSKSHQSNVRSHVTLPSLPNLTMEIERYKNIVTKQKQVTRKLHDKILK